MFKKILSLFFVIIWAFEKLFLILNCNFFYWDFDPKHFSPRLNNYLFDCIRIIERHTLRNRKEKGTTVSSIKKISLYLVWILEW